MLAYLIGLPASEIPAIEVARGDLLEVVPTSYGVHSQAYHFWDGPGRTEGGSGKDESNFYENYAESTKGKRKVAVEEGETLTAADVGVVEQAPAPELPVTPPTINIQSEGDL